MTPDDPRIVGRIAHLTAEAIGGLYPHLKTPEAQETLRRHAAAHAFANRKRRDDPPPGSSERTRENGG